MSEKANNKEAVSESAAVLEPLIYHFSNIKSKQFEVTIGNLKVVDAQGKVIIESPVSDKITTIEHEVAHAVLITSLGLKGKVFDSFKETVVVQAQYKLYPERKIQNVQSLEGRIAAQENLNLPVPDFELAEDPTKAFLLFVFQMFKVKNPELGSSAEYYDLAKNLLNSLNDHQWAKIKIGIEQPKNQIITTLRYKMSQGSYSKIIEPIELNLTNQQKEIIDQMNQLYRSYEASSTQK